MNQTIFALATAPGRAGVAVVRIAGPDAVNGASRICGSVPDVRGLRPLRFGDGALIDKALVLRFAAGHSFTGDEIVEFHTHGSPAIIDAVLSALGQIAELAPAEPGEFTRRALENGQLDLAEVEGLADLIDAQTEGQRKQAMRVFAGELGKLAESWRRDLIRAAALLEATIDFVDEDVPVDVRPEVIRLLLTVQSRMQAEAQGVVIAERVRSGFEVAIIGTPNVGKSTLLNRLAGRDVALISDIPGTTRDVLEVQMDLGGLPVTILDTAGQRQTDDIIEGLGVARASERAARSDLRLHLVLDADKARDLAGDDDIIVQAKGDIVAYKGLAVSGMTGEGIDDLVAVVKQRLESKVADIGIAMRDRHRSAILDALSGLEKVLLALNNGSDAVDLIAEDLRVAIRAIDCLVGRVDVEHVLDEIFSSFCIGK